MPTGVYKRKLKKQRFCKIKNCKNKYYGKGYCNKHYKHIRRHGKILERTCYDKNEIIDCGDYYEICIYNQKNQEIARAKIDKDDLGKVKNYKWYIMIGYLRNNIKGLLHQLILGKKRGFEIDHINHDTLDNRKQNLRHCTRSQNSMNKKNVKGITWNKNKNKWQPQIMVNYKSINLGYFIKKQDAIKARKQAEQKYFGEFAFISRH